MEKRTVSYTANLEAFEAKSEEFDAIIIPGGGAPEALRVNKEGIRFVKVVVSKNLITSRTPVDEPALIREILAKSCEFIQKGEGD